MPQAHPDVTPPDATGPHVLSAPPPLPTRSPTSEQRLAIRNELDKQFDDSLGMYLGDTTDQSIAEQLHVPRAWVDQIREVGYGSIRITPEMQALRKDIEQVTLQFQATRKSLLDEVEKRCGLEHAAMQTLLRRMDVIEGKS